MIHYHYNNDPSQLDRRHRFDYVSIITEKISRQPLSFKEECDIAARKILEKDTNIWLGLTGGWASNVILQSFLSIGFKPNVFIMELPNYQNSPDNIAKQICKDSRIEPLIIESSVAQTIPEPISNFAKQAQIYSYYETILASKIRTIPGRAIIADPVRIRRDVDPTGNWSLIIDEDRSLWPKRYTKLFPSKRIISDFFMSSPEILLSFLESESVRVVTNVPNNGKLTLNSSRNEIFNSEGFNKLDKLSSYDGHDMIPNINKTHSDNIEKMLGFQSRKFYINLEELKHALRHEERIWKFV